MVDAWPAGMPQAFEIGSYTEGMADGLLETQPDTGPPQTRRRSTAMPRPVAGQMIVTRTQLATLRTFVNTTLLGGALAFNFPATTEGGTWLVKFPKGSLPKWSSIGGDIYMLQLSLLILP